MMDVELTDAELDAAIAAALTLAHNAPFGECNLHADGTREIRNPTYAWARDAAEWVRLCAIRDRRIRPTGKENAGDTCQDSL